MLAGARGENSGCFLKDFVFLTLFKNEMPQSLPTTGDHVSHDYEVLFMRQASEFSESCHRAGVY